MADELSGLSAHCLYGKSAGIRFCIFFADFMRGMHEDINKMCIFVGRNEKSCVKE